MDTKYFWTLHWLLLLTLGAEWSGALPQTIKIGGLFDIWDPYEETGFRHAIEKINAKRLEFPLYDLAGQLRRIKPGDSYNASRTVCQLLKEGVAALLGPQSATTASHVQSVAEVLNVPHIETKWDFRSGQGNFLINLFPDPATLSLAYADVIRDYGWTKIIVIYENNESLVRLQGIFESTGKNIQELVLKQLPAGNDFRQLMKELRRQYGDKTHIVVDCHASKLPKLFQDAKSEGMTNHYYRYFLTTLEIHTLHQEDILFGEMNVTAFRLVDPKSKRVEEVVEAWKFRPTYSSRNYFGADAFIPRHLGGSGSENIPDLKNDMLPTETALIYDAIELITRGLHSTLDSGQAVRTESLNCDASSIYPWAQGAPLMRNMKEVSFEGLSGHVVIDEDGKRRQFRLYVMELMQKNLTDIGYWDPTLPLRLNWTRTQAELQQLLTEELKNATLKVSLKETDPYCKKLADGTFEGYSVDLLMKLAEEFKFQYVIHSVYDNKHGLRDNRSEYKYGWNGMIGEILSGEADLAIGDMSITFDRMDAVDFTMPFMNLGISILYKKPAKKTPGLFSFLDPFHYDVWIYMATAYLGVSLILFILARITPVEWNVASPIPVQSDNESTKVLENQFSELNALWLAIGSLMGAGCDILPKLTPYEWLNPHPCVDSPDELELTLHLTNSLWFTIGSLMQQGSDIAPKLTPYQWLNPHPCKDDPDELVNDLTLLNSMWHNWGSIMQQGSDIAPKAGSTRMVAGIWWFFTLIMISSYTANLAAFLTSEGLEEGIKDIKDLPKQTKVKYGTLESGSTREFFRTSKFPLYTEIYKNMESMKPPPFVKLNQDGVNRVFLNNGLYAFFMESVSIEYYTERNCSFTQLGGLLDSKGYGIALKKGSRFRDAFNTKILELSETGQLDDMKKKWWKTQGGGKCATEVASSTGATALTLGHVGGVFVVLLGGCGMACVMACFEFMWKARKLARDDRESIWIEMWKELKFALQCKGETKPIKKTSSLNPTLKSESVPFLPFNEKEPRE